MVDTPLYNVVHFIIPPPLASLENPEQVGQVGNLVDLPPEQLAGPSGIPPERREQDMLKLPSLMGYFLLRFGVFPLGIIRFIVERPRRIEEGQFAQEGLETLFFVFPVDLQSAQTQCARSFLPLTLVPRHRRKWGRRSRLGEYL